MGKSVEASTGSSDVVDGNTPEPALETEVIRTSEKRVACDGGLHGHPQVWLNLGEDDRIVCPYCSRVFVLAGSRHDGPENNGIA